MTTDRRTVAALAISLVASAIGGLLALGGVFYLYGRLEEQIDRRGRFVAESLADNGIYGVLTKDGSLLHMLARAALEDPDVALVVFRDVDGLSLASAAPGGSSREDAVACPLRRRGTSGGPWPTPGWAG